MHEELYLASRSKIKYAFLITGLLLLPLSFLRLSLRDGAAFFEIAFELPILLTGAAFLMIFFENVFSSMMRLAYPFLALLLGEFLRFGSISIFDRELPFDLFLVSAAFSPLALGYAFMLYFIANGKMRTKIPLLVFSALCYAAAAASCITRVPPFFAYDKVTEGALCFSLSHLIAFLAVNTAGLIIGLALRDDKAKAERREAKARKKAQNDK